MKNFIFILLLMVPLASVQAQELNFAEPLQEKASPVVVELFSSENCPACPPADEFMGTLSQSKGVIALSCHVDYFGKTAKALGREFCTDRQSKYIQRMGRKSHFTPQMMINGHMSEVGYETLKVSAGLVKGRADRVQEIEINPAQEGVYHYTMPEAQLSQPVTVWMAIYDRPKEVNHRGRIVTYYNVVKRYIPLGQWQGTNYSRAVFLITDADSLGFAIVAQDQSTGKIIAAGDFKL
jgi:hypothetical protein